MGGALSKSGGSEKTPGREMKFTFRPPITDREALGWPAQ